jgi:hypothetical protein
MAMKVQLSFKATEKDMYEHVTKQLSASIYLKELLKKEINKQEHPKESTKRLDMFNF